MSTWKSKAYPWGLLILGILFMGIGISRGEPATVLTKAIYICLECIGIG